MREENFLLSDRLLGLDSITGDFTRRTSFR
jgi:hypothetical protein